MKIVVVASGSKGNACLLDCGSTLIQIDMGVPLFRVKKELSLLKREVKDIQAVLVTHEHSDHVSTLSLYHGKIPLYAGEGTLGNKNDYHVLSPYVPLMIGDFNIVPFPTSHDATSPMGFVIEDDKSRLGYVTDTGLLGKEALSLLQDCDYYYFESNHDSKMLEESNRPLILKRRIRGRKGHLSNVKAATYLAHLIGPHTKGIYLAHLSEECNTPELALNTLKDTLLEAKVDIRAIEMLACAQWGPTYGGEK